MINKIYNFMQKYKMLDPACDGVIVGVSGGADSVCLLLTLKEILGRYYPGIRLMAVHVNHGIRGAEAMRDQTFAEDLCKCIGVKCVVRSVSVPQLAKQYSMTEEETGRMVRYQIFRELASDYSHAVIAVAHHKNDQAETVLMNLMRGSAIRGLSGMQPVRKEQEHTLIRPLLCVTRQEIEDYLKAQGQDYLTDSTNLDNLYTRNKVRNVLIPYLEDNINPNVTDAVCEMAESVSMAERFIERQSDLLYEKCVRETVNPKGLAIELCTFLEEDPLLKSYVVRKAVYTLSNALKDVYRVHIESILGLENQQVGKRISLPYGLEAVRSYTAIELRVVQNENKDINNRTYSISRDMLEEIVNTEKRRKSIRFPYPVWIPEREFMSFVNIVLEIEETMAETLEISDNNIYTKYFDYDKIKGNIEVRFRKDGDRIVINRDGIVKKFKKELIDRKIPKEKRDSVLLLTVDQKETDNVGDTILWAVGVRRSETCLVDNRSVRILKISIELQEEKRNETR